MLGLPVRSVKEKWRQVGIHAGFDIVGLESYAPSRLWGRLVDPV